MRAYFCIVFAVLILASVCSARAAPTCASDGGLVLQVLGSGGPIADDGRASSGYLLWHKRRSRVLVDVGSGVFLRLGEAQAQFDELDFVGLSHFHTDHSADFVALLKSGSFGSRARKLVVAGPDAGGPFPGLIEYLDRNLDSDSGAYRYLSAYLDPDANAPLEAVEVADASTPQRVFVSDDQDLQIDALHVPHGIVPALGFRVTAGNRTIVLGTDQNGSDPRFVEFAKDADLLVMHMVIPEGTTGPASRLHAEPSRIGQIAQAAGAKALLLSHLMARSLRDLDGNVATVDAEYDGLLLVAEDLACVGADASEY